MAVPAMSSSWLYEYRRYCRTSSTAVPSSTGRKFPKQYRYDCSYQPKGFFLTEGSALAVRVQLYRYRGFKTNYTMVKSTQGMFGS
eukprot:COSAG01_NODE_2917_length_6859_cov_3.995414_10_plen_85_part_00